MEWRSQPLGLPTVCQSKLPHYEIIVHMYRNGKTQLTNDRPGLVQQLIQTFYN